jgi:hypothetical protein
VKGLEEVIMQNDLQHWGDVFVGIPMLLLWGVIVTALAIATRRTASPRWIGQLSAWTALCYGVIVAAYAGLVLSYPAWYRPAAEVVTRLLILPLDLAFLVTLGCCIASWQLTPEIRLLGMKTTAIIGLGALGLATSQVFLEGWQNALAQIASGLVLAAGLVYAQWAQARMQSSPPR